MQLIEQYSEQFLPELRFNAETIELYIDAQRRRPLLLRSQYFTFDFVQSIDRTFCPEY
jgi:hypothetical protein